MARYLGPRERIERRLGERLGLKGERSNSPKSALVRRPYAPGQHGPTRRPGKMSEFGSQLKSKQKVRNMYRLLEKPFKGYVKRALETPGQSPFTSVVRGLETRLDNVIFRMGIAQSRDQARQLVGHGHVQVNGKRVKTPSYAVRVGDIVMVRERSKALPFFTGQVPRWLPSVTAPSWIELDKATMSGTVKSQPAVEESGIQQSDLQAIIEYYSR